MQLKKQERGEARWYAKFRSCIKFEYKKHNFYNNYNIKNAQPKWKNIAL